MSNKIIYGVSGPDGRLVYVGTSKNDAAYVEHHHRSAAKAGTSKTPINDWINEVGFYKFKVEVLETVTEEDAKDRQQWWIDASKESGHPILNLTKEETSERVRQGMKESGTVRAPANRPSTYKRSNNRTGFHLSEEHKAAISRAHKGKVVSEETRKKISEKAKGHKRNLGRYKSEATRLKMSHTKHQNGHVVKGITKDTCRWCGGDIFTVGGDQ